MLVWKTDLRNKRVLQGKRRHQSKNKNWVVVLSDKGVRHLLSAIPEYRIYDESIQKHGCKVCQLQWSMWTRIPDNGTWVVQLQAINPFPGPIAQHGYNRHTVCFFNKSVTG